MVRCTVVAICLAGCGFSPSALQSGSPDAAAHGHGDGAAIDARSGGPDAARDASTTAPDAAPDAAKSVTGSLDVSSTDLGSGDQDLTADGTTDWGHWGTRAASFVFERKQGGSAISNVTGTPTGSISGAGVTSSWSDGTPDATGTRDGSGYWISQGHALSFTVAAGTAPATLDVHVSAKCANGQLAVSLSDGSASPVAKTLDSTGGLTHERYTITFNAASAGQTLTVAWSDTQDAFCGQTSPYAALFSAALH